MDASDADFPTLRVVRVGLGLRRSLQRPSRAVTRRSPSSPAHRSTFRPHIECGQVRRAPLLRFALFLCPCGVRWSRRTARSLPAPGHPASALLQPRHPRQEVGSPMRFLAPRVSGAFICVRWRRRPRGSFAADFFRLAYRARTQAVIATSPGPSKSRRRPWDSAVPFAVLLPPAGDDACSAPRTHLPFRHAPPRVSSSRSPPDRSTKVCGRGSWGLAPRTNRAV